MIYLPLPSAERSGEAPLLLLIAVHALFKAGGQSYCAERDWASLCRDFEFVSVLKDEEGFTLKLITREDQFPRPEILKK